MSKNPRFINTVHGLFPKHANCTFENFKVESLVVKEKIEHLHEMKAGISRFLLGGVGCGKTHLAVAMMKNMPNIKYSEAKALYEKQRLERIVLNSEIEENRAYSQFCLDHELYKVRPAKCLFLEANDFLMLLNYPRYPYGSNKEEVMDYLNDNYDCICLDDLGSERPTEAAKANIYTFVNMRYKNQKSLIITTNLNEMEMIMMDSRLWSRMQDMGKVVELFMLRDYRIPPDADNKKTINNKKFN